MEDLIGSQEACQRLGGINKATLFRWAKEGRITPVTKLPGVNGAALWNPIDVDRLAESLSAAA